MKVSSETSVSMPIKNMLAILFAFCAGIFGYTELTSRLTSLETSRELMLNDLLKASDQKPIDQEQFLIQESLASDLEKTIIRVDEMMHNGVNIERMMKDINRLRNDVEMLKDKLRESNEH
tara:strand:- start:1110 stop:1469 length:360 start_codon:yes stop_codon:yes gene_type:complete